jgi:Phosphodiester glycosidase
MPWGLAVVAAAALLHGHAAGGVHAASATIAGHAVTYVIVPLDRVRIRVALGEDRPGRTESLAAMASRHHAIAAINGGFFEAYAPGPIKNLIHTIIVDGNVLFKGDVGDELYFDRENNAAIEHVPLRIEGALDGSYEYPDNWYAYWLNRLPEGDADTITIFTPDWGTRTGLTGFQVQVENGLVTAIGTSSMEIPRTGYVVYIKGETSVARRFAIGRRVEYRIVSDGDASSDFLQSWQAIGGGPRLLTDGRITIDARAEKFNDPRGWASDARSMIGISRDGRDLILAVSDGTLEDSAAIMLHLGAYQAMNLDDNASSGLWFRGHYLREPGRLLNNALLVLPRN